MTRRPAAIRRAEELLGTGVVATAAVAGGETSSAVRLRLTNGHSAPMKSPPGAPEDYYPSEASDLAWLQVTGGVPVPRVLAAARDCLIVEWIEPGNRPPTATAAVRPTASTRSAWVYWVPQTATSPKNTNTAISPNPR